MNQFHNSSTKWAAFLFFLNAIRWLAFDLRTVRYILVHQELPTFFGIRSLSGPISETYGVAAVVTAQMPYAALHLIGVLAGILLLRSHKLGGFLGVAVIAASSLFWIGFAVPYGPLIGIPILYLILSGWKTLEWGAPGRTNAL